MWRLLFLATAVACATAALFIGGHYPRGPLIPSLAVVLGALCVWRWPASWLFTVPALLPVCNGLPWTGWVAVEEFDLLLLATAAGGYARLGFPERDSVPRPGDASFAAVAPWLIAGMLVIAVLALGRGIADAGGPRFGWFDGYGDAINSLRVFKGPFFAGLMFPLLLDNLRKRGDRALRRFATGVVAGLALTALLVLDERAAYPGLFDFSTHYRATAWFWEMHVGGAALDAYLALAVPFAAWALFAARRVGGWLAAAALVVFTGYAVLMTFSRGVYLALPIGLAVLVWLRLRCCPPDQAAVLPVNMRLTLGAGGFVVLHVAFNLGGYGAVGVVLALAAAVLVVLHFLLASPRTPIPRAGGGILLMLLVMTEIVAVMNGGSFMMGRLLEGRQDFGSRVDHWRAGLGLLETPGDWLLGQGLGRLPARFANSGPRHELPADFRLQVEEGNSYVLLSGPPSWPALAGLFGMAQRVPIEPGASYRATFDLQADTAVLVQLRVCEMHLLYEAGCVVGTYRADAGGAGWQHVKLRLRGDRLLGGVWYAQRPGIFSVRLVGTGAQARIDNLILEAGGRSWLVNGDFASGLAHWFLSGQYYFLPWHVDNLPLEILIDQGLLGLTMWVLLLVAAFRHLGGRARTHPLAPILAAALAGFLAVGLFASLMDVPRVSFLFWLLCSVALALPVRQSGGEWR
jgi:hypothetical protein